MGNDFVVFPKHNVPQANWPSAAESRDLKVFTAAHGKEKTKQIVLLECLHEGAARWAGSHAKNLINAEALLVFGAAI